MLQFIKALWAKASRTRGSASRRSPLVTLNLECLEQRCLPSILWIGGHGSNWSNRLNWQGGVLPGPNDTAEFNKNSPSSTVDVNRTIGGVQLDPGFGSALIINQGKTLKISGGSEAAGIITGPGTFEIQHSFTWSGGRMGLASNARGTTQIDKGASMLISGTASAKNLFLSFRTVQNLGDVTFAADQLRFRDSTFTNRGKFMITGDGDLTLDSRDATSRFDNFGIFSKIGTPGIPGILPATGNLASTIWVPFTNEPGGQIGVLVGDLKFEKAGTYSGTLFTKAGTSIIFAGATGNRATVHKLDPKTVFQGDGLIESLGGRLFVPPGAKITIPNYLLEANAVLALDPGGLGGAAGTLNANTFDWEGGEIQGAGEVDLNNGDVMTISSDEQKRLTGTAIVDKGTIDWQGGKIITSEKATITMDGTSGEGRFDVNTDQLIVHADKTHVTSKIILKNLGTLNTPGGKALPKDQIQIPIDNQNGDLAVNDPGLGISDYTQTAGLTSVTDGTLAVDGTFEQDGGNTLLSAGTLSVAGPVVEDGGTLAMETGHINSATAVDVGSAGQVSGTGTIQANVSNDGTVAPGGVGTPGILAIASTPGSTLSTGDYAQDSGTLDIDIGGTSPGTGFDQLNIEGDATLGGTLNVSLINGFKPSAALGQTIAIMTFQSSTGTFDKVTGLVDPDPTDPYAFEVQYNPTNVSLVVVSKDLSTPTVTGLSPSTGTTAGGTQVVINGTNFGDVSSVDFGTTPALDFTVNSTTQITAVAPPAAAGVVDVLVSTTGATSATSAADQFTYTPAPAPAITAISPSSGYTNGLTEVAITGTNFTGATAVMFGNQAAEEFTVNSDTSITAFSPAAAPGTVDVQVSTFSGTSATSAADKFTYTDVPTPAVTGVSPASGSTGGGTAVTLTGTGFTNADGVFFGAVPAGDLKIVSDSSITVTAPPQAAGTVDITVTAYGTVSTPSSADRFTYNAAAAPAVTAVSPTTGSTAGGTVVTITGSNFTGASSVMFGTAAASDFAVNSDTQLTAVASPQAAGTVDVTVTTPTGTSATASADRFTYTAAPAPAVTTVSPNSGSTAGGSTVTITGTNFTGASAVSFGAVAASSYDVLSDGAITATAPAQAAGVVDMQVTTPSGTSAVVTGDHYTYTAAPGPAVSAITPSSGDAAGGTVVTVTGTNFTGASAVSFGAAAAADYLVNSDSSITATAPAGTPGTVDVTVTTPSGTSTAVSADHFTYTATPVPAVTGISPSSGSTAGGTVVTLTGTGFTAGNGVSFGGVAASDVTVNSDSQITVVSPPESAGTVDVTVVSPAGTSAASSGDRFTYTAATTPAVSAISPTSGTTAGGTQVTVTGTNFSGASGVSFGSVPADFFVNSDTSITATAPAQAAGTVDVTVTTPTGTSASTSADHFSYTAAPAPAVSSITPTSGPTGGGTSVTVTGTGFTGATGVSFGNVAAADFFVNSDTSITATSPAQAAGTVHVTVTTYSGTSSTSSADQFTYTAAAAPTVTNVTPNSGMTTGATQVTVVGSGFTGASGVKFGSLAASAFSVNSDSSITAFSPAEAAGTVDITVTTYSGTSSTGSADSFTYTNVTAPAPAVTGISPSSGSTAGGQVVTVTGTNFSGTTGVTFGATAATNVIVNSDSLLTATAPAGSAGTVDVKVTTNNGTSSAVAADQYTYLATPAPTVTGLSPTTGTTAGGTSVTISGTNFTGATAVSFGGVPGSGVVVNSSTSITATSPAEGPGTVDVTVTTPSGTSATGTADHFTYTAAPAPTVTAVSPNSGSTAGGTSVTISGTNFTGANGVSFGGVPASGFTVNSATSITATSPPEAAGTIDVTVSTFSGSSATSSADRFTYTAAPTPAVTAVSPNTGSTAGGTSVTITGTNFTGAQAVSFGGVGASFTVNSDTSITATAPAEAAGTVDVTVTTFTGMSASTSADHFTYTAAPAPTVTAVSPSSGSTGGGTVVTITGTGFTGATGVSFGSVPATGVSVNSDASVTATAPAQAAGTVDVTVTTYAGTSSPSSADHYTYTAAPAPAVTTVTPSSGSTLGGTLVTVLGSNFTGASAVTFGSTPAASFNVQSDGALTATAPAHAAGTVDITVTTPTGTSGTSSADHYTYTAVPAPVVTGLSPTSGSTAGGTTVTITGSGFTNADGVSFGNSAASSFVRVSDTTITAVSPAEPAGTVDVTVSAAGNVSAPSSADRFTYTAASAPAVTAVSPSTGSTAGGTVVTVTGTNFTGANAVSFGGIPASGFTVTSSTSITATSPSHAAGTVEIVVSTPTGTSAPSTADHFTYTAAAAPSVTGVSPASGSTAGGTVVTVTGSGFTGASGVSFGSVAAGYVVNSDTRITATSPAEAAGTVHVTVTTPSGTSSTGTPDQFTYIPAAGPAVTGVTPASGSTAGGTVVTITGSGFTGASTVKFGGTAASSFTVSSASAIIATAPAGSPGTVDVTVTTPSGTSGTVAADHFTYTAPAAPTVTGINPSTGGTAGGTVVIVTGTGFTGAKNVSFGPYWASRFAVNSDTQITAVSPAQPAGTVDVVVTNVTGNSTTSSADHFTYTATAAPAVTAVSPSSGPTTGGTVVTISGSHFTGASGVAFGANAAVNFSVFSDGSVVATAPAGSSGTVDVTVTTPSGTSAPVSADHFTYVVLPKVTAVSPNSGPGTGGTVVTITGSGFFAGTPSVYFGGTGAGSYRSISDTQIIVTSPAHAAGTVDVTVTNLNGTSANTPADQYTFTGGGNAPLAAAVAQGPEPAQTSAADVVAAAQPAADSIAASAQTTTDPAPAPAVAAPTTAPHPSAAPTPAASATSAAPATSSPATPTATDPAAAVSTTAPALAPTADPTLTLSADPPAAAAPAPDSSGVAATTATDPSAEPAAAAAVLGSTDTAAAEPAGPFPAGGPGDPGSQAAGPAASGGSPSQSTRAAIDYLFSHWTGANDANPWLPPPLMLDGWNRLDPTSVDVFFAYVADKGW